MQVFRRVPIFTNTPWRTFSEEVFAFLSDWAIVLSATTALLLVIATFTAIRENRRIGALNRIRVWATDAMRLLPTCITPEKFEVNFETINAGALSALIDARAAGGNVGKKVGKAVITVDKMLHLFELLEQPASEASVESLKLELEELMRELTRDLGEVMASASEV